MRVTICDVAPRDGLQNDPTILEPETRAELVDRLAAAGLPRIEAVSFVNPARVPQMAGAEEVVAGDRAPRRASSTPGSSSTRGATTGCRDGARRGARRLRGDRDVQPAQPERLGRGVARGGRARSSSGPTRTVVGATVTIGASFGCPFEGASIPGACSASPSSSPKPAPTRSSSPTRSASGVPRQVKELVGARRDSALPIGVHLHNTRNTGFANAFAAVEAGATVLDASVGGIGGCPFAPRATGNICTEDLVYMLHGEGVETGIDLDALIEVAGWLEGVLERQLRGQVYRAGTFAPVAG